MKQLMILLSILISQSACAELQLVNDKGPDTTATLSWVAPITRTDGSTLSPSEIQGFEIAYATLELPGQTTMMVPATDSTHKFTDLTPDTWQFAIRTVDTNGVSSDWSDIVTKKIVPKPAKSSLQAE